MSKRTATPVAKWSRARLAATLRLWKARLARRQAALARIKATKTSRTPRTRLTPERKIELLEVWRAHVAAAERTIEVITKEQKRRVVTPKPTLGERAWLEAGLLVGVMEVGGNNQGRRVMEIIRANGGVGPEPWCGDFVAWCYRKAGSTVVERAWAAVRYLGYLTGMKIRTDKRCGKQGDILCFTFDHTGLLGHYCNASGRKVDAVLATHVLGREGNTGASGAVSDSSTGGDGVYEKIRPIEQVARVVRVTR